MRRCYLILVCLLLSVGLHAQNSFLLQYWLDRDYSNRQSIAFGSNGLQAELDFADLNEGLHSLDLQVQDTGGWSSPASFTFLKLSTALQDGEVANATYKCWVDRDSTDFVSGSLSNGTILLDFADLGTGLHRLNVLVENADAPSYVNCFSFLKINDTLSSSGAGDLTYKCWFDNNFDSLQSGSVSNGVVLLETSWLEPGIHTVNVIVESGGIASYINSYSFLKLDELFSQDDITSATYKYWFDGNIASVQSGNVADGAVLLETAGLESGLHTIDVIVEVNGIHSFVSSYMFYKLDDALSGGASGEALSYSYWFDEDFSQRRTGTLSNGNLMLETDSLPAGIHYLNIQVNNSTPSALSRHLFFKEPLGGLGVCKYEYWLNDDFASRTTVEVNPPSADYELVSLMPMDTVAFNPMSMYFDPNEGSPIVYAQNKIHFRFWNNLDFFTDTVKTYVDTRVYRDVIADSIERNSIRTFPIPEQRDIKWYTLYAETGDSLIFKGGKTCTIQLFSPSGNEIFHSSGSNSTMFKGCHAWEDGVYYLAVHSITQSNSANTTIHYNHISKFALLSYTPDSIGNKVNSRFFMDYLGNGFNYLTNVFLTNLSDTIFYEDVVSHDICNARVQFLIDDTISNGLYDLHLVFRDQEDIDTIVWNDALNLQECIYGDLIVSYSSPSRVRRPYPVDVTIKNTGNIDYVYVPLNIAFTDPESITDIKFSNFSITMSKEADSLDYNFAVLTDNLIGMNTTGCLMFTYLPIIKANEEITLSFEVSAKSNANINLYAWTGEGFEVSDFIDLIEEYSTNSTYYAFGNISQIERVSATAENVLGLGEVFGAIGGLGGRLKMPSIGHAGNIANNSVKLGVTIAGIGNASMHIVDRAVCDAYGIYPGDPLYDDIMNLHPPIASPGDILGGDAGMVLNNLQRDRCDNPSNEEPNSYNMNFYVPVDPNEIYGYVAESGSLCIKDSLKELNYEIEFENDTLLATAPAHTIVVKDTLNPNLFNLSTFEAHWVTIGEKLLELNGEREFVYTMDMRPDINAIAQIQLDLDTITGIAIWTISSLDPITLEPATELEQGVLPINFNGDGIGRVAFSIDLKDNVFTDSVIVDNYASIFFDQEDPIHTSVWRNVIDVTPPQSEITNISMSNSEATLTVQATDNISGVWKYDVFAQYGANAEWEKVGENIPIDSMISVRVYDGMNTGFVSIAIDSAGNMENKPLLRDNDIFALHVYSETNEMQGYVNGLGSYDSLSVVEITAVPNSCYNFVSWNDGNTNNPRTFTLTKDTCFTAIFESIDFSNSITAAICEGTTYTENGFNVSEAGVYTQNLQTTNGCDSIVTLTLTVNPVATTALQAAICEGTTYTENGFNVSEAGVYTQNLQTINGCDSTVTLTLTVNPVATTALQAAICEGTAYTENGFNVSEAGVYTQNLQTINGCDSTVTLTLTVNPVATTALQASICEGTTYTENGFNVSEAGVYTQNLQTINGCDSTVTLTLTVNPVATTTLQAAICEGTTYTENGFNVSEAGVYTQTLTSVNGCDSVVTLTLNVNPTFNTELTATICEGSVYTENNFNVSEAGVYTQNLTSVNGCDSIVTLTVSVNPVFDTTINATINSGETYAEFGFNESESGTYVQNLQTVNGCDSTITLNLTVNSSLSDVAELTEITFYPNPTSGILTFSKEIEKIEVIDNIGKIVMRFFDTNGINIETLPSGAYYLRMTIEDKTIMRKVIKE